jgi:predicted enzyme related to lactoylglutathione lyase
VPFSAGRRESQTKSSAATPASSPTGTDGSNGTPDVWSTYISTADIDATVGAAAASGAQVLAPPMAVGDLGSMAFLRDPAGGHFGVWQAGTHTGFTKYNEPGSVTWDEYHSKNFDTTTDFYSKLFDWQIEKMSDTAEFRYFLGQVGGETVAGLMDSAAFLPAEVPSHWAVYFSVADVDAASAVVEQSGGTIARAAEDTPFGRMADALDPTGAAFKLHQPPPDQANAR